MKKNLLTTLFVLGSAGSWLVEAEAHVPKPTQIARFQPSVLRGKKAFQVAGQLSFPLGRANYAVDWSSPGHYEVVISDLPAKIYSTGEGASTWRLSRSGNRCVLRNEKLTTTCPPPKSWALLEWGGQPELTANTLHQEGFFAEEDVPWSETNSADPPTNNKRVHLAVGKNGETPVAVLEVRGPQYQSDASGESFPILQLDQTFLSPLAQRFMNGSELVTIRALSDLLVSREQPRFSHVLAKRLDVGSADKNWMTITRKDPTNAKEKSDKLPTAITDHTAFQSHLGPEGQQLLRALLLTH